MESTLTTAPMASAEEMNVPAPTAQALPSPPVGVPYLFNAEQFLHMIEAGIFPREARVELWDGMVQEKMAKNRPHAISNNKFVAALVRLVPRGWHLAVEDSFKAGPGRVPLPDLMIVRGAPDDYRHRNPEARDVALLIELSDSSLRFDTGPKRAGYARAGAPLYWVADLNGGAIRAYRDPIPGEARYAAEQVYARGQSIPFILDGEVVCEIPVSDLLHHEAD